MLALFVALAVSYILGASSVFFISLDIPVWVWYMAVLLLWLLIVAFYLVKIYAYFRSGEKR